MTKNTQDTQDTSATEEAASASQDAKTADAAPVSVSTSDNVLSASEGQVTVGGVTVIEHVQDDGQNSSEGGA